MTRKIGLALSGGGSRAMAFHLGCMRALHDAEVLEKVSVLSAVSGGSVIAALYAYTDDPFETFAQRVEAALAEGMVTGIARQTLASPETAKIAVAILLGGGAALLGRAVQIIVSLLRALGFGGTSVGRASDWLLDLIPRFASRTTAFERHLRQHFFGERKINEVQRPRLAVVINAAELRTETAFRFGSAESGCWRFGRLTSTPKVATAVACSAAFPAFLPAIDRHLEFEDKGHRRIERAIITDGGVYDNFGISCMLPGRSSEFSTNALPMDFIIACDAGAGLPTGARRPYFWPSRMLATIVTIHRRTQTLMQNLLHRMAANKEIEGFILPYLGQNDANLPFRPADLVMRAETFDYPTDFSPMKRADIDRLSLRGEQLTRILLDTYAPDL